MISVAIIPQLRCAFPAAGGGPLKLEEVMSVPAIIVTIILVISAVLLIGIVLLQSGKSEGLSGALVGSSSDSFLGRNKSHTWDAKIARATKWIAAVFLVCTFVLNLL